MNTSERVIDIINVLASADGPIGISDISRKLSIGKNNVYNVLTAMESKGWVRQESETKRYGLTGAIARVALKTLAQLDIQKVSLPYLYEIQQETGETSALTIKVGLERILIYSIPGRHDIRHIVTVGERRELWIGSGGKAILAFMPETEIDAVLERFKLAQVSALPDGRVITVESLRAELAQIKSLGYAVTAGERNIEACGLSAPIFNYSQEVVGCLSVSGPILRFDRETARQYSSQMIKKANSISLTLGAEV